jgi:hypothetical protein
MEITIRSRHTPVPKQLDKYIGHVKNKQNLCQFLCEEWCSLGQEMLEPGQEMVVAGGFADGTGAVLVSNGQHDGIGHLKSDHEEADTRRKRCVQHPQPHRDSLFRHRCLRPLRCLIPGVQLL